MERDPFPPGDCIQEVDAIAATHDVPRVEFVPRANAIRCQSVLFGASECIPRIALEPHDVALAERMSHLMPHHVVQNFFFFLPPGGTE